MADTFSWKIDNLIHLTSDGLVINVTWTLTGDREGLIATSLSGSTDLPPPASSFIPYDQLTEEIVIGWIQTYLGQEEITELEKILTEELNEKQNPTKTDGLPWEPGPIMPDDSPVVIPDVYPPSGNPEI